MTDMQRWRQDWDSLARKNLYGSILSMNESYTEQEFMISGMNTFVTFADAIPDPCERIVDLGCGAGRVLMFAKMIGKEAIGIDISEEMLLAARARLGEDNLRLYDSFESVESGSVDFIYTVGTFKHLTKEMIADYLTDAARVMRKGGRCWISYYSKPPSEDGYWVDESSKDKEFQHPRTNRVIPEQDMMEMLESRGFRVLESDALLALVELA